MAWSEPHKTVKELAELWSLSESVIRGLFEKEPDVMVIERPETRFKRGYSTMRIPESAIARMHLKLVKKSHSRA